MEQYQTNSKLKTCETYLIKIGTLPDELNILLTIHSGYGTGDETTLFKYLFVNVSLSGIHSRISHISYFLLMLNLHTRSNDQIKLLMFQSKIGILTFSETWLKPHLHQNIFALDNYSSYRLDRSAATGKMKRGGGLIKYIHDKHSAVSESLDDLNLSGANLKVQ